MYTSHYKRLFFWMLAMFLLCACNKSYDRLFDVRAEVDFMIQAGINPALTLTADFKTPFLYESKASSLVQDTTAFIDKVVAIEAVLEGLQGTSDLDFLENIIVKVVNPSDVSDDREVFYLDPVQPGQTAPIEFFPSLPDIEKFISDDEVIFRIKCQFRRAPTRNYNYKLSMVFSAI